MFFFSSFSELKFDDPAFRQIIMSQNFKEIKQNG